MREAAVYSRPAYPLFEQEECERNHQDVGAPSSSGRSGSPSASRATTACSPSASSTARPTTRTASSAASSRTWRARLSRTTASPAALRTVRSRRAATSATQVLDSSSLFQKLESMMQSINIRTKYVYSYFERSACNANHDCFGQVYWGKLCLCTVTVAILVHTRKATVPVR